MGWSRPIVHIDGAVWCVAVGSSYPGCAQAAKGVGVHALKGIVSWVKNVKDEANDLVQIATIKNAALRASDRMKNKIDSYRWNLVILKVIIWQYRGKMIQLT